MTEAWLVPTADTQGNTCNSNIMTGNGDEVAATLPKFDRDFFPARFD
jgi:hypothetical protein